MELGVLAFDRVLVLFIFFISLFFFPSIRGMKIEELEDAEDDRVGDFSGRHIVRVDAKRALVGAGARILFYPTLLYNVLRNKIEAEFRWWDEIDQVSFLIELYFWY